MRKKLFKIELVKIKNKFHIDIEIDTMTFIKNETENDSVTCYFNKLNNENNKVYKYIKNNFKPVTEKENSHNTYVHFNKAIIFQILQHKNGHHYLLYSIQSKTYLKKLKNNNDDNDFYASLYNVNQFDFFYVNHHSDNSLFFVRNLNLDIHDFECIDQMMDTKIRPVALWSVYLAKIVWINPDYSEC